MNVPVRNYLTEKVTQCELMYKVENLGEEIDDEDFEGVKGALIMYHGAPMYVQEEEGKPDQYVFIDGALSA